MATITPELQPTEEYKDKGLKSGALGLVASVTMGVASTAPAYSLAATLAFVVVLVGFHAPIVAVLAFVPMLPDLDRLQRAEQGGPRLRHHLHVGHPGVRPEDRLGWWLGHRRRRRPGHGQPGPGGGPVRVPALRGQEHRREPDQRLGAAGRHPLDRRDDLHLLPRHRGLGVVPEGAAEHRARHAAGAVGDRAGQGRHGGHHPATSVHIEPAGSTRSASHNFSPSSAGSS